MALCDTWSTRPARRPSSPAQMTTGQGSGTAEMYTETLQQDIVEGTKAEGQGKGLLSNFYFKTLHLGPTSHTVENCSCKQQDSQILEPKFFNRGSTSKIAEATDQN